MARREKTAICVCTKSLQSCPTVCDAMDCSPSGSSVHGILQARILKWVAILQGIFPTQGSKPHLLCLLHWQAGSLPLVPPGKPENDHIKVESSFFSCFSMNGCIVLIRGKYLDHVVVSFQDDPNDTRVLMVTPL